MRISKHAIEATRRIPYAKPSDRPRVEYAVQWAIDEATKELLRKFKGRKKR